MNFSKILISTFLLLFIWGIETKGFSDPGKKANNGELILDQLTLDENHAIPLSGEWEFFYGLLADEISPDSKGKIIRVPGDWKEAKNFNSSFTEGFGTYRLKLKNLNPGQFLGLKIPTIHSASRIIVDGEVLATLGKPGKSEIEMVPKIAGQLIFFQSQESEVDLMIEVSNFHFFQSGIWYPIYFGTEKSVLKLDRRDRMYSFLLVGGLLIMGFYHLFLVFIQRQYLESLFFGLACILLGIRELAGPDAILLDLFPYLNHGTIVRLVYLCLGFAFLFQTLFVFKLFLTSQKAWIYRALIVMGLIFGVGILVLSTRWSSIYFNYFTLLISPVMIIWGMVVIVKASLRKAEGARIFLIGLFFFYGSAIHDYIQVYQTEGVDISYWMPYGFFFLILSESVVLSIRYNKAFINEAALTKRLTLTNESLRRFIPSEFLKLLGKDEIIDVQLGDSITKDMTVFFADVRNFTSLSEGLSSKETFEFVNRLLTRTDPIIRKNSGFIDKYIGDAVMALFEKKPDDAISSALELQNEVKQNNLLHKQKIGIGIGIHYGNLILGTVGSEFRMDGTVISDAVNSASRIEELTKTYKLDILISEDCKNEVKQPEQFNFRMVDMLHLRGKKALTKIYEVYEDSDKYSKEFLKAYHNGMIAFRNVEVNQAKTSLEEALELRPHDGPCHYFLEKIAEYNKIQENLS